MNKVDAGLNTARFGNQEAESQWWSRSKDQENLNQASWPSLSSPNEASWSTIFPSRSASLNSVHMELFCLSLLCRPLQKQGDRNLSKWQNLFRAKQHESNALHHKFLRAPFARPPPTQGLLLFLLVFCDQTSSEPAPTNNYKKYNLFITALQRLLLPWLAHTGWSRGSVTCDSLRTGVWLPSPIDKNPLFLIIN